MTTSVWHLCALLRGVVSSAAPLTTLVLDDFSTVLPLAAKLGPAPRSEGSDAIVHGLVICCSSQQGAGWEPSRQRAYTDFWIWSSHNGFIHDGRSLF
ncbi:unnamed protein product [Urochloa humidicola]